ncbi:MAG TPA: PAS domain S-box protein, partial [Halioglobus sp.]
MDQPRYLNSVEYIAIAAIVLLTMSASDAEPFFAALQFNHRLYLFILWNVITVVIAGITFSVGWQTFSSDRIWAITLVSAFLLGAGLFNAYHLFSLNVYVGLKTASVQEIAAAGLWARVFTAVGLLLTAAVPPTCTISGPARLIMLGAVLAISTAMFVFMSNSEYPQLLSMLFVDEKAVEMHSVIPASLACAYGIAAFLFLYRLRQSPRNWLRKLFLAVCLLALAELNFMLIGSSRHAHPQLGHILLAFGFMYIYRGVFLYSIQWPVDQMNDWQARLKTSQRELAVTKLAVDGSGYYIFEFDEDGKIRHVSDNICRRMGYAKDELIGTAFSTISAQSHDDPYSLDRPPVNEGDAPKRYELDLVTKNGEIFPVANTTTYIKEDDENHISAIMEDISDRKRFEAQLAENERYLRRVIDSIPFFVTILTPEGFLLDNNKAVHQSLQIEKGLSGKRMIDFLLPFLLNDNAEQLITDAIEQARSGQTVSLELHTNTNGVEQFIEFTLAPVRDDAGNVVNLVNTSADITDRLRARNELRLASTVFDYSAEAILITDGNKHTLSVNRAFTTITGFEEVEMLGRVPLLFEDGNHLH